MGLIKAVDRYDPARGKFPSYAIALIRGAIREALRSEDWVPRLVRQQEREGTLPAPIVRLVALDHRQSHETDPNLPFSALPQAEQIADPDPGPESLVLARDSAAAVRAAVARLPETRRRIVQEYVWQERTMKRIAATMGRSESRIHQQWAVATAALRECPAVQAAAESVDMEEESGYYRPWTPADDQWLQEQEGRLSPDAMAAHLGRSTSAIKTRLSILRRPAREEAAQEEQARRALWRTFSRLSRPSQARIVQWLASRLTANE